MVEINGGFLMKRYFSSESVTEGHPDKVCDNISDAILDACLAEDKNSRVAVETLVTTEFCCVAGEVTTNAKVDFEAIARKRIAEIGYNRPDLGFSDKSTVLVKIHTQSPDISQGVTAETSEDKEQGAGDQGMMFGFACKDTPELMPLPIMLSHKLAQRLTQVRNENIVKGLRPDGKSQVSVEYDGDTPKRVDTVVIAAQHDECDIPKLREEILDKVIKPVLGNYFDDKTRVFINKTGKFVLGGPAGDTGVTGRKIIVDTYGGMGRHGGGAFSGKDPSKVDRSAAYAARYVAKNIVAADLADKCEVQVSYVIGYADPLNILVECFGTNKIPQEKIEELVKKNFSLKPAAIISELGLKNPIYHKTCSYGHFGKTDLPWEQTNKANDLKIQAKA